MFVVIEGVDGVGKSTLGKVLAAKIGATLFSTPTEKYRRVREQVDEKANAEEHYRFYRDSVYDVADEINSAIQAGRRVVCDRYWLSTYTSHHLLGVEVSRNDFIHIVQPDLTVLLTLNLGIQITRMLRRGMSVGDKKALGQQSELALEFYQNLLEFSMPFIALDTGRFLPECCAEIVARALEVL